MLISRARARRGRFRIGAVAMAVGLTSFVGVCNAPPPAVAATGAGSAACPWVGSSAPIPQRVNQLLSHMSLSQEVSLLTGASGSRYVGFIPAIGALCIPALNLHDGPAGPGQGMPGVTQLPAPVSLAASWDTSAGQTYGSLVGSEQASKGTTIGLGPTVDIVRDPRFDRAFETFGEDPYLNGQMGAADIRGVQSTGVMAQVKHIAAYNTDTNRNAIDAMVDTRTLQELYLPAFRTSIQQGVPSSVMCATSYVNGDPACQGSYLLTSALRQQFGFSGFVTSDWGAIYPRNSTDATIKAAKAGLNQDMPGDDGNYGSALVNSVTSGALPRSTVDTLTSQVLSEMFAFGLFDRAPSGSFVQPATSAAHVKTAKELSQEGTVLLKNSGNVLPLGPNVSSIAVIGKDADSGALTAGGGSANVASSGTVTPLQGITARAGNTTNVVYDDGASTSSAAAKAASSSVAVVFVGKYESENKAPAEDSDINLSDADNALVTDVAKANPHTIVVLNTGSAVAMPWVNSAAAVLEAWYPGQESGNAIAELLFGDANPSGHLPVTFPTSLSQTPTNTTAQWPGTNGTEQFSEGLNVGYRWYDTKGLTPLFPFGYGLSYTSFSFSNLSVSPLAKGGKATVIATVTNTGSRQGADVAQLYLTAPASSGEPPKRLAGFTRVDLQPGQSKTVTFPLTEKDLQYWDSGTSDWSTATGTYTVSVGDSSRDLPLSGTLPVVAAQLGQPVTISNPGPQEGIAGAPVTLPISARDSTSGQTLAYTATGLPAGVTINPDTGAITGTPTTAGTTTATITAQDGAGATASTAFTWTVTPVGSGIPTTPLIGYKNLCLDVFAADNTDSTKADIYTCNGTTAQDWTVTPEGSGGTVTVQALGKCLDVRYAATTNGTPVQLYTCNGTGAQSWIHRADGSLFNPHSGRCLDDPASSSDLGTPLQIWDCNGAASQRWVSPAAGPVTGYSALCLDVRFAQSADGTPVQVYTCNDTVAQYWNRTPDSTLQALGKCLDVAGGGTASGTPVQLWTCNGGGGQQWVPQADGTLRNPASGRCLEDSGAGGSGTQAQIGDCNASAAQKWALP
ncbi:glycoside hydrolase family 3 C-terminal domain-containing protein [Streptomyces sp. NPDC051976]|uniref:glycoside hydrolase family 3 C-terminal domain-containing protein n=1 Tax=Streptomyces sp. NPDC051976 TaxID=3154947 RepID=UPI0034285B9F